MSEYRQTEFKQYIAEEIAIDHAEGQFSRREALRRLGLLGLSTAAAGAVIAACDADSPSPSPDTSSAGSTAGSATGSPTAPGAATAVPTEMITFPGPNATLRGAYAAAAQPKGAVLVIHENKGLTPHIAGVAGRLAGVGFSALAIDLLSEEGGTAGFTDPARATAALGNVPNQRFVADEKAAIAELQRRTPGARIGVIGFCFGGGQVWSLLASGAPDVSAAVPFYGPLPAGANFAGSRQAAVFAVYAGLDKRVDASRPAAEAALTDAGLVHQIEVVPGVDHAFFNDTGPRYDEAAATRVWGQVLDWYGTHLASR